MFSKIFEFIKSLYPNQDPVLLHAPVFWGNEKKYLIDCVDSTFVSYVGEYVTKFETLTAQYAGSKHAVAVVNGTAALQIALQAAGVKTGEEVITQPLTFVATANAISHSGGIPVFVDVDEDTLGMSPNSLLEFLEKNCIKSKGTLVNKVSKRRIAAVLPVHVMGHPCRIDEIVEIAERYNVPVIEDAAEAIGSFYNGKHLGTFGLMGIFSYNGNKTITAGGGGMIVSNNEMLEKKIRHITTTAKIPHPWEYEHDSIGYNYRLTNINAALGVAQMENLEKVLNNKRDTALLYNNFFSDSDIKFITEPPNSKSNYWLNSIVLQNRVKRDEFLKSAHENKIMARPLWRLMNKLPMYSGCLTGNLKNSEWAAERVVNIPSGYRSNEAN